MPQPGWHRADIMAALRKQGSSLAEVARREGFARCTMSWALIKPHARALRAIAETLGVSRHELWPQWYGPDGAALFKRRPASSFIRTPSAVAGAPMRPAAAHSGAKGGGESSPARAPGRRVAGDRGGQ